MTLSRVTGVEDGSRRIIMVIFVNRGASLVG